MQPRVTLLALMLGIVGCGGGGGSDADRQPTTSYTASVSPSSGGRLVPSRLQLAAGQSGSFRIEAESGHQLDSIRGCGGTLSEQTYTTAALDADCTIEVSFISHAALAIRAQQHSLASGEELIDHARASLQQAQRQHRTLASTLFAGIDSLSWHPTHDSITFTSYLPEMTTTVLQSNVDGSGNPAVRGLIMASELPHGRAVAMAGNLFSVNTSAQTDRLLRGLIHWLTAGADEQAGLSVVTAQVPSRSDSHYFPHNEAIRSWLASQYPDAHRINDANSCDYAALSQCIDERQPDLIILSDIDRQSLGYAGIAAAISKAQAAGIPLLLANYQREASPLLSPLYQQMGLTTYGNYWSKLNANAISYSSLLADDSQLASVDTLLANLRSQRLDMTLLAACSSNFIDCNSDGFVTAFKRGADWLRSAVITLDQQGRSAFTLANADLLKATLLLADKYRSQIDYPIEWTESAAWQQAMFADWLVNYARPNNAAQADLGEFVTERNQVLKNSQAHYAYPATGEERKTIGVPYSGQWTTTGWYVLPGQTITLTRHDSSSATVEVKLNYHRRNTNRAYEQKVYRGPLELATQRLRLEPGASLSFSSPYGGPLYLALSGGSGALQTDISASGITWHPSITDFSDANQIATFQTRLQQTELPHVDLRSDGAEQHLRRDRLTNAIGTAATPDVASLLRSIADDHINAVYTLAGLKIQGQSLADSLPADVVSACSALLGEACLDADLHTRSLIQHANYDQNAQCGAGCSGNPWDAAWDISPTGWGDNHELGHNLQTNRLNVQYVAANDRDNWPSYSSRAGENSNNLFPYFVKWRAHYLRDGNTSPLTDGHMNHKDLFYVFMSDVLQRKDASGNRQVVGANCQPLDSGDRYEGPWKSNAYAVHNGYRMAFYIQMALRADGLTLADGTGLDNGFNLFTLLYQHSRLFGRYAANADDWLANRDRLGFSLFPYEGHTVYGGNKVSSIPGNDFMLVALSRLTGLDWRSHFELLGLRYSSLAAEQVALNASRGALPMGMYVLETNLPPANLSAGLTFLPLATDNASTLWPDGSSPAQCAP
ncbi:ImpA family metalloprotease [Pseudaeromonas sharmana]|uniref:ImpA family metalloprotease n=1 Tax=Pseudaeromonas sharmana TaxID=328412 RepID=A0ABV8CKZ6_9GAMM